MTSEHMRRLRVAFMSSLICLLAACAGPLATQPLVPSQASSTDSQTTHPGQASQEKAFRAGRFSLVIDTEPVQSFIASFELAGGWPDGVLTIYNPLGMQMARVEWTPQGARFVQQGPIYGRKRDGQDMRGRVLYRAWEQDEGKQMVAIFKAIEQARVNFEKRATVSSVKASA